MKHKYYINKSKHIKVLTTAIIIGLSGLIALVLINVMFHHLTGGVLISFLLGGAVFLSLTSLYRTIFLLKLPLIVVDDESVSYFNVLWYNKYYWDKFEIALLDTNQLILSLGLRNGRVYDKFS